MCDAVNLYVYWVQKACVTHPTLPMAKHACNDAFRRHNCVFWIGQGQGFRNSGCGGLGFWRAEF